MMRASIVIPTYNASERLYYNLLSLSLQNYDKDGFEAIVVDNGSTDNTQKMLSTQPFNLNMKIIKTKQNQSRGRARNLGIQEASGDIIIFCDSDMICTDKYVESHISEHKTDDKVVCGNSWDKIYTYYYKDFKGSILQNLNEMQKAHMSRYKRNLLNDKQCLIDEEEIINGSYKNYIFTQSKKEHGYSKVLDKYGSEFKEYCFPWSFFITNNCSVRKENIIKAGMFDESYEGWGCEDLDLGYRLYKNNCTFVKRDIQAVHQEHPIKSKDEGIKNIYRFTEKYDSIEIYLFYFSNYTAIEKSIINDVVRDVQSIEKSEETMFLVSLFKDMLKMIRDRELKLYSDNAVQFHKLKNMKDTLSRSKENISAACLKAEADYGCSAFITAFHSLAKQLFKIEI